MMSTIHLVYPHGNRISAPDSIGRNLAQRLEEHYGYSVKLYDWAGTQVAVPEKGDVLLGHPHPLPSTCFRLSMRKQGWRRILPMSPYCHGKDGWIAFLDPIVRECDLYLAITGRYWFERVRDSLYAHWASKMVHLNLAVDRADFPVIKKSFSPVGQRKLVYIGNTHPTKNVTYLGQIANRLPGTQFAWIGNGSRRQKQIAHVRSLGTMDFSSASSQSVLRSFDFMITVGHSDANPTTILESMAWGLIPVCTPQSGYESYPGIVNLPLNNTDAAVKTIENLQMMPEVELHQIQKANWRILDSYFNWDRFTAEVVQAIESTKSPSLGKISWMRQNFIAWQSLWQFVLSSRTNPVYRLLSRVRSNA